MNVMLGLMVSTTNSFKCSQQAAKKKNMNVDTALLHSLSSVRFVRQIPKCRSAFVHTRMCFVNTKIGFREYKTLLFATSASYLLFPHLKNVCDVLCSCAEC